MIECLFTNFKKGTISAINAKQQNSHWVAVHWSSADYLPNNDAASSSEAGSGTPAAPPKPAPDCPPFLSPPFLSPSLSIFPILTPVCVRADDDTDADDDEHDNKNCDYNNTLSKRPDLPPLQRTENRESAQPDFARFFPSDWTTAVALLVFCDYTWFLLLLLLPSPYITFLDTFLGLFFSAYFCRPWCDFPIFVHFCPAGFSFTYTYIQSAHRHRLICGASLRNQIYTILPPTPLPLAALLDAYSTSSHHSE